MKIFLSVALISLYALAQSNSGFINKGDEYFKKFDLINAVKNYEAVYEQNPKKDLFSY